MAERRQLSACSHWERRLFSVRPRPRVVVIGGGPGGATAAKYIAKDSQGKIEVVLVEPQKEFTTCFHSNLYLGGYKKFEEITHKYDTLASKYGIKLNHQAGDSDRPGQEAGRAR